MARFVKTSGTQRFLPSRLRQVTSLPASHSCRPNTIDSCRRLGGLRGQAVLKHRFGNGVSALRRGKHITDVAVNVRVTARYITGDDVHVLRCNTEPKAHSCHHVWLSVPKDGLVLQKLLSDVDLDIRFIDVHELEISRATSLSPLTQRLLTGRCITTRVRLQPGIEAAVVEHWSIGCRYLVVLHLGKER